MTVTVRRAAGADVPQLAIVAAVTFPLACPPHTSEEAKAHFIATVLSEERFREYLADAGRRVFVAVDTGTDAHTSTDPGAGGGTAEIVGYVMLNLGEPSDADVDAALRIRPTSELSKCYVMPGHHGAGVAGALMDAALEAARATGAVGVWLGVNEENGRAQAFYAKHGFARVGTKHFLVGDRLEDDYVLERSL
jgi:Acetyltransferases